MARSSEILNVKSECLNVLGLIIIFIVKDLLLKLHCLLQQHLIYLQTRKQPVYILVN